MQKSKLAILLSLTLSLFMVFTAAPVHAQATRTWVSGVGDDVNPCSRTAPCKTFAGAISKTAAGGEISVLDPGGFGAVTITKSISLVNDYSGEAGILASGTNAVTVNAGPNDIITLRGLVIDGAPPAAPGLNGVRFIAGAALHVQKSVIKNFTSASVGSGNGILFAPASGTSELYVSDTVIEDCGNAANGNAIAVLPTGSGSAAIIINRSYLQNSPVGLRLDTSTTSGTIKGTISNSEVSGDTNGGIVLTANVAAATVKLMVSQNTIANNGTFGVITNGVGSSAWLFQNAISGNGTGISNNGGQLFSYKNNGIDGNGAVGSAPTPVTPE